MKVHVFILTLAAGLAIALTSGCKKSETPGTDIINDATKAVTSGAADAQKAVKDAAADATKAAGNMEAAMTAQAQTLIDKAKGLVDSKPQEAMGVLSQLTNLKLTPEQQKVVDDLKAKAQAALAKVTEAGKLLGK